MATATKADGRLFKLEKEIDQWLEEEARNSKPKQTMTSIVEEALRRERINRRRRKGAQ